MSNVFKKFQNFINKPNRNTFDLSFVNNFTTDFGRLTPVFCKEVLSGDSVNIATDFGLNFAPMMFPVQTKMKCHVHFFYVRTRTLWKNWMDFIGNTKEGLVPPYIDFSTNQHLLKSCSLADYLGVPTTLIKPSGLHTFASDFMSPSRPNSSVTTRIPLRSVPTSPNALLPYGTAFTSLYLLDPTEEQQRENYQAASASYNFTQTPFEYKPANFKASNVANIVLQPDANQGSFQCHLQAVIPFVKPAGSSQNFVYDETFPMYLNSSVVRVKNSTSGSMQNISVDLGEAFATWIESLMFTTPHSSNTPYDVKLVFVYHTTKNGAYYDWTGSVKSLSFNYTSGTDEFVEAADMELRPYGADVLPISALPFRAYEAIYNSFYRNPQNNPFFKDGKPEYNTYITNDQGGADSTVYDLYKRNWEDDPFTTAVQSPQQGVAPLVGVSASGEFTFQDDNGTYKAQANFAEDGETITSINIIDNRMPAGTTRALVDMVSTGISINDFRNVNALQRWLEKNMRRGLRYKDQMMSHFGSDIKYDELLMPEFIGGTSCDINMNRIINTAQSESAPLGSFGGLAQAFGGSKNNITHYADEHGFIIGILSVVPYANYSQVLPKMFTRNSVLDYYFPEFGCIGMQPITNKDFLPLQCYRNSNNPEIINKQLSETFGYQRPWWDYISTIDEVHGMYRTHYRDYLLNRVFGSIPKLTPDFLTIDSADLNDVFATTDDLDQPTDKILGCIRFNYKKKTTIPEYGIPQLEVQ